jgi:DNA-binding transcriptional ArsR family regulator
MNEQIKSISDLDRVIHEPARLMLVALLSDVAEVDFLYLLRETGMTKGNLSSHLSKLEAAGYVEMTKTYRGKIQMTLCCLTDEGHRAFNEYRAALQASLDAMSSLSGQPQPTQNPGTSLKLKPQTS